jgi:hypothetical protein
VGQPVKKIVQGAGNALGLIPDMPNVDLPAPAAAPEAAPNASPKADGGLPDPQAQAVAADKLAQEKLRKGRKSLRIDLSTGAQAVGSGVAIPT